MATPANWGKLVNFQSAERKSDLIPFGLFSPNDNLGFIAGSNNSGGTWVLTSTPPDGSRTGFTFAGGTPQIISWNGINQFQNVGFTISGNVATFIDVDGNVLKPGTGDDIRAQIS